MERFTIFNGRTRDISIGPLSIAEPCRKREINSLCRITLLTPDPTQCLRDHNFDHDWREAYADRFDWNAEQMLNLRQYDSVRYNNAHARAYALYFAKVAYATLRNTGFCIRDPVIWHNLKCIQGGFWRCSAVTVRDYQRIPEGRCFSGWIDGKIILYSYVTVITRGFICSSDFSG